MTPISPTATDQDVVNRAVKDPNIKWELNKLAREMGEYSDYRELPIVVYKKAYDGNNRRVILAKNKSGYVTVDNLSEFRTDFGQLTKNVSLPANGIRMPE